MPNPLIPFGPPLPFGPTPPHRGGGLAVPDPARIGSSPLSPLWDLYFRVLKKKPENPLLVPIWQENIKDVIDNTIEIEKLKMKHQMFQQEPFFRKQITYPMATQPPMNVQEF